MKSVRRLVAHGYHDVHTKHCKNKILRCRLPTPAHTHGSRTQERFFLALERTLSLSLSWRTHVSIISLNRSLVGASKNKNRSADGANSRKDAANVTSCAGLMPTAIPRHKSPAPGGPSTPPFVLATPSLSAGRGPCDDATGGLPAGGDALRPRIPGRVPFSYSSRAENLTF